MLFFDEDRPIFSNSPSPDTPLDPISRDQSPSPLQTVSNSEITTSDPGLAVLPFADAMEAPAENSTITPEFGVAGSLDASALEARAAAAIAETESDDTATGPKAQRVDSAQGGTGTEELCSTSKSPSRIPPILPRVITPPAREAGPVSPCNERLPSFRQFTQSTRQLSELAEAAASREPPARAFSAISQSPRLRYHHTYPASAQTSPVRLYDHAMSPTQYGSPPQNHTTAYYAARRTSAMGEPPPMLSASSSSESHGYGGSSSGDGYSTSTAHTTPIEPPALPSRRPILPPPPGMPASAVIPHAVFSCDHSGCGAEFLTQYLLHSHRNVHSSNRPHYCPVQDCARAVGGKGFKRKNEMIRHGLVHNSPGYVCPFCRDPDRQHAFPRPDNLWRHCKKRHPEKSRDDATLREVLAQRIEGSSKSRKRRNTMSE